MALPYNKRTVLGPANWSYVNSEDKLEAMYWAIKWDVTVEQLVEAVARVGHAPRDVELELRWLIKRDGSEEK